MPQDSATYMNVRAKHSHAAVQTPQNRKTHFQNAKKIPSGLLVIRRHEECLPGKAKCAPALGHALAGGRISTYGEHPEADPGGV